MDMFLLEYNFTWYIFTSYHIQLKLLMHFFIEKYLRVLINKENPINGGDFDSQGNENCLVMLVCNIE